jgi:hypothetical protein
VLLRIKSSVLDCLPPIYKSCSLPSRPNRLCVAIRVLPGLDSLYSSPSTAGRSLSRRCDELTNTDAFQVSGKSTRLRQYILVLSLIQPFRIEAGHRFDFPAARNNHELCLIGSPVFLNAPPLPRGYIVARSFGASSKCWIPKWPRRGDEPITRGEMPRTPASRVQEYTRT